MADVKNEKKVSTKPETVEKKTIAKMAKVVPTAAVESTAAKKEVEKKAEPKTAMKKTPAKKTTLAKKTEKKATSTKTGAKKTAKKAPEERLQEVYFEYEGQQILSREVVEKIEETYKAEGHRISSIKSLRVYINPDEQRAYYVINDKAEGKFVEL